LEGQLVQDLLIALTKQFSEIEKSLKKWKNNLMNSKEGGFKPGRSWVSRHREDIGAQPSASAFNEALDTFPGRMEAI
jgi:hypothetical protein